MRFSIPLLKFLFRIQKTFKLQPILAKQFYKPEGLLGRVAIDFMAVANKPVYNWAVNFLELKNTDHVLEIGFGHGVYVKKIAEKVADGFVAGVDISADMVRQASLLNQKMISAGRVALFQNELNPMPFADDFFDSILAVNVIYFWPNPEKELLEINRVLKPGGRAVMYLTDKESLKQLPFTGDALFTKYDGEEFAAVIKKTGFAKTEVQTRIFSFKDAEITGHCVVATK
ncbi:MAG: methyltransferase domain-containing protein [Calditrichaeota bacterium]|nr:MAG: methyltransferase domain-containing protein [Calditrichota bacterium]